MTRTTELLKEIEFLRKEGCLALAEKSELKGRLDALKEEVEFLEIAFKKDINYKIFDIEGNADFKTRLASIQEEIKLIGGKI